MRDYRNVLGCARGGGVIPPLSQNVSSKVSFVLASNIVAKRNRIKIEKVRELELGEKILKEYYSLFDNLPPRGDGHLRFGYSLLRVSDIASQYYCEKKLELRQEHPFILLIRWKLPRIWTGHWNIGYVEEMLCPRRIRLNARYVNTIRFVGVNNSRRECFRWN